MVGPAGVEPRIIGDVTARLSKPNPGTFVILLIHRPTGRATRVDLGHVTVDAILRAGGSRPSLLSAYLRGALVNAAVKLDPDFEYADPIAPIQRKHVLDRRRDKKPVPEWVPRWLRRRDDSWDDEGAQGLTEYALVLALIVIVAVAALTLIGSLVASMLSAIGASIQ